MKLEERWPGRTACLRVAAMLYEAFRIVKLRHRQAGWRDGTSGEALFDLVLFGSFCACLRVAATLHEAFRIVKFRQRQD